MNLSKRSSVFVIGMALFAMFFGSGNLIYPLYIGMVAGDAWLLATAGFLTAAVVLPFLGVVAMVLYKGCYETFFKCLGRRGGLILSALLLTVWIPLGSAPRCMTLAFASLSSYTTMPPSWVFAFLYSALVFIIISRKLGVLDILGRYITPLLLGCLAIVFFNGTFFGDSGVRSLPTQESLFWLGLKEGYNTMDLIASFFFSASVIHMLNRETADLSKSVALVLRAGLVGMGILAIVYLGLISVSSQYAPLLASIPKDQMLAYLAQYLLGPTWSIFAIVGIVLACFSTSIALIIAYADFLSDEVFKNSPTSSTPTLVALVIAFIMSLFGLEGITSVTSPILQICYPILLVLIIVNVIRALLPLKVSAVSKELAG